MVRRVHTPRQGVLLGFTIRLAEAWIGAALRPDVLQRVIDGGPNENEQISVGRRTMRLARLWNLERASCGYERCRLDH